MRTRFLSVQGACALAIMSACPASAQQADAKADEAISLFSAFCVQNNGSRDRALVVLGAGNALANRLPEAVTDELLGQQGTVGWAISSPGGAQLMLAYGAREHCEVRVAEADEDAIVTAYDRLRASYPVEGLEAFPPEPRDENGARVTFRGFRTGTSPMRITVALTSSNRRVVEQQHFLTYDLNQITKDV